MLWESRVALLAKADVGLVADHFVDVWKGQKGLRE